MEKIYQIRRIYTKKTSFHNATEMPTNRHKCWVFKEISEMIKVLFICHGNICRSPMAEFVLKDMVAKRGLAEQFEIASAATSTEEISNGVGNPVYPPAKAELAKHGLSCEGKRAVQLKASDYDYYDYLIGMDMENISNIERMTGHKAGDKIHLLLEFNHESKSVRDPWYYDCYDETYRDVVTGCTAFLAYLKEHNKISL